MSAVSASDRRAEVVILEGLRKAFPHIACVAEEEASAGLLPPELGERVCPGQTGRVIFASQQHSLGVWAWLQIRHWLRNKIELATGKS